MELNLTLRIEPLEGSVDPKPLTEQILSVIIQQLTALDIEVDGLIFYVEDVIPEDEL